MADRITLQVARYRPEQDSEVSFQEYEAVSEGVGGPRRAQLRQGSTGRDVVLPWSCRMGICGSCGMTVNGEPKLTCATFLTDYAPAPCAWSHYRTSRSFATSSWRSATSCASSSASSRGSSGRRRRHCRKASIGRRRRNWRNTSSTACASTACCAMPPARSTG